MTDSLKFGPEWLRNMSSDNSGSSAGSTGLSGSNSSGSGTSTSLPAPFLLPRFQQAEYRYGREEMLSLCEKDMKLPEILPSFKKIYVEKEQLPLALSPSTEDEGVYQFPQRYWPLRGAISLVPPPRLGRGGSVDRGRGRPRACAPVLFPTRAPFDDNLRAGGRGVDRSWPERNGGSEIGGSGDWNGSPSSSPRKEYNAHGRTSGTENWRRNRVEDETGDGWRSSNHSTGGSTYRWSRSTSWRDEDSTNLFINNSGGSGSLTSSGIVPITRSLSSSASMGQRSSGGGGNVDRITSHTSNGGLYQPPPPPSSSHELENVGNESGPRIRNEKSDNIRNENSASQSSKANLAWDQEDIPEWAMENTADGGGSFDASGAFHVPDDEDDSGGEDEQVQLSRQSSERTIDSNNKRSTNGQKNSLVKDRSEKIREVQKNVSSGLVEGPEEHATKLGKKSNVKMNSGPPELVSSLNEKESSHQAPITEPTLLAREHAHTDPCIVSQAEEPAIVTMTSNNTAIPVLPISQPSTDQMPPKNHSSDLADRMQEVADDMVEKLIMEDEMTATSTAANSSNQVSLIKSTVSSNSPTGIGNPILQRPTQVHSHPIVVPPPQVPPSSSNDMWYYRDPQNKIQGPFTGTEMAEWYRSDYFDENLFVRRVCDSRFATLGELVKMCGNSMPFLCSHLIPPLQMPPVIPLSNQASTVVPPVPSPMNISQSKPISIVNPLLSTNDMAASLNLQLQYLQKEHLIRQQSLILSKLSASEQFAMLSPERQQQIIQQQMTQVSLPDNIVNLPAFINFLHGGVTPSAFSMQQMIPPNNNSAAKTDLNHIKIAPSHNTFVSGGGQTELPVIPTIHNIIQSSNNGQPMIPTPQPLHQNISASTDDQMKAFLRHLQAGKTLPQNVGNAYPQNVLPTIQQVPWLSGSTPTMGGPVSMWDFDSMINKMHAGIKPEMKTEEQILEEQRQQQMHAEKQTVDAPQFNSADISPPVKQSILVPNQQKAQLEPQQPKQQHQTLEQLQQVPSLQQQQRLSKKSEEKLKVNNDDTLKASKADESKRLSKSSKVDKKEPPKLQKLNDEDRKREAAEERKKQKEEKKKQLIEEEKKRQHHLQEEEKRRQMLEEKKRQEEIDRHRRAKMLENAPPKTQKASPESSARSSIAPWSNTTIPSAATRAASLAEIQKAERERRTEERLELIHQRKIQQMETLSKIEPTLTWNAPPISVKSLAEIQAEEHKNQQQVGYEQTVTSVVQRRKKEDVIISQPSTFIASGQNIVSTNAPAQASSIGSIWSSWNGKPAWATTTSNVLWEEPTKLPTTTVSATSVVNSKQTTSSPASQYVGSSNRLLSKSQTFSSIQTSFKNSQNSTGTSGNSSENKPVNNTKTTSNSKPVKVATNKAGKSSSTNATGSVGLNSSNNKKDDARNEFTSWCIKALSSMKSTVDVPTFIQFLQDIESPYEVKDYIRIYLGETKECTEFAKQFLERRSKYRNQQRAQNAHIDDMCSPAPAVNPSSNDFQEVKGKSKKVKKSKMTRLDARILGFSVTAAQDRINVGDRDYGDTA